MTESTVTFADVEEARRRISGACGDHPASAFVFCELEQAVQRATFFVRARH
ncbi:MAG: hypothetical protein HUU55_17025, partial [Myxococcales bacterium]|nr:hypothetical protein [Myxococcales bacterium]